jgi:hypothetical protein
MLDLFLVVFVARYDRRLAAQLISEHQKPFAETYGYRLEAPLSKP